MVAVLMMMLTYINVDNKPRQIAKMTSFFRLTGGVLDWLFCGCPVMAGSLSKFRLHLI